MAPKIPITALVAVYGAVLSTFVLLRDLWSRRARARVSSGYSNRSGKLEESGFILVARIANRGRESIFLARCGVEIPGWGTATGGYADESPLLPAELKAGQSFDVSLDAAFVHSLAAQRPAKEIRVVYWDQLGRRYRGPIFVAGEISKAKDGWSLTTPTRISIWRRSLQRLANLRFPRATPRSRVSVKEP